MTLSLDELAGRVGGELRGDGSRRVRGVATLEQAGPDELSFLANPRYRSAASTSRAAAILVAREVMLSGQTTLVVEDVYTALAEILELLHPPRACRPGIHPDARVAAGARLGAVEVGPFAVIDEDCRIADGVVIGPACVVGRGVQIGPDTVLMPGVVVYPGSRIGARCLLHSGVVLGADGFGFATREGRHRKVPQVGAAVVGDDVEIGANSTIDRAALGETVIGSGTKIDDLVMVAHGVRTGRDCMLVAQSGIAGSTRLGERVTFAGQSGAAGHLEIGDGTTIAAKTAVFQDLGPRSVVAGVPAVELSAWKRSQAWVRRLPELGREIRELRQRLAALERRFEQED